MDEKIYLVALHSIWFTHKNLFVAFESKQNYRDFFNNLTFAKLVKYWFLEEKASRIIEKKENIDLEKVKNILTKHKVAIVTYSETNYPENLKNIFNKPYLLYVRGHINSPSIAFIGSRAITYYGKTIIEKFIPEVWKYFSIVSWWAIGCDSYAHEVALKNHIKTISVVWTWIDIDYPSSNKRLYDKIVEQWWWIVSIFPLWERANPYNFPVRNEIVAGLSLWIVIVEAKEISWTLITAKLWLDLWKDVFAVPWDIYKQNSQWCNNLISAWEAKITLKPADILTEYNISNSKQKQNNIELSFNDEIEKKIYDLLLLESLNIDEISEKLSIEIPFCLLKISILELSNLVRKWDSWKYQII